jgi:hypothetical protein
VEKGSTEKVNMAALQDNRRKLQGRFLTAHNSPALAMLMALSEGQSITNDDIGDPTSAIRLDKRAVLG